MGNVLKFKVNEPSNIYGIDNPHDKLFKDLLNDIDEFKKFITKFVGIDIKNEQIEKVNTEYISQNYKRYQSDIVYKIKDKDIYIMVEHQSTIDLDMPYRILIYYTEKLKEIEGESEDGFRGVYPVIIPIVLYSGEKAWNIQTNYNTKTNSYNKKEYLDMRYELIDINDYSEEELLNVNTLLSYAMLIERNRGKQTLLEILEKISAKCDSNYKIEKMQNIINYILKPILQEDIDGIVQKFKMKEEVFNMKTAQDYIREEIQELKRKAKKEGIEKGIEKGIKQGSKQIIINMIKNKVEIAKIKEYTGVNEKEIKKIAANI